ncbi:MAG: hypothetical protein HZA90_07115 [Verrucomicrobia bacterium]|nr:hypothetical protein [Verrucomicrobiota bacterium]
MAGLLLAALLPASALAQSGLGDIVYTVATTTKDSTSRDWAFILWQATTPSLVSGRSFAIYAKPGFPSNAAPYTRLSVAALQTDARSIEPLLRRAENVGEDSAQLGDDMMQLFASLMPTNTISRADQLSAVIRGSLVDEAHFRNLVLLARNHPGVALCLGMADAQMVTPGVTTFEIRNFDPAANRDVAVVGRVTVDTANPTVLPRPGPPVLVPETTAQGDINLKFRWGTPDALRRLGLLQFGYNLWRVQKNYAVAQGWHVTPPTPALLTNRWLATTNIAVRRVNRLPIINAKVFTVAEAANLTPPAGDTNTLFIADDDGRFLPGYVNYGFTNGAQFYYFVTARDVLAHDGLVSTGLLATVCDRLPPQVPVQLKVINDYSYNTVLKTQFQSLRVYWNQNTNTTDRVTNYWVYRWTNMNEINLKSGNISNNLIAVVPHVAGSKQNSYLDNGPTAPKTASDLGKTFWYTVRAGDSGACGQNLSGNSGPAFGVLRDRVGPAAGNGFIDINCTKPRVDYWKAYLIPLDRGTTNYEFVVECTRRHRQIAWAEFSVLQTIYVPGVGLTVESNFLGRRFYSPGNTLVDVKWAYPLRTEFSSSIFYCRAGMYDGKVSPWTNSPPVPSTGIALPDSKSELHVAFLARGQSERTIVRGPNQGHDECRSHDSGDPGDGSRPPIIISIQPTPTSREWKLYRRVDNGPLSLICQGEITNILAILNCFDDSMPANAGTLCYFFQLFDEHGNPSALTKLGCVEVGSSTDLPTPLLSPITSVGNTNNPGMNLLWFCPPYGLERFEVWIGALPTAPGNGLSALLAQTTNAATSLTFTNDGTNATFNFYVYHTPKVGPSFGNGGAQFLIPANISMGKTYAVFVKAVGSDGTPGEPSNFETFVWNPTNTPGPQVPWPARGLPPTNANFGTVAAFLSPTNSSALLNGPEYEVGVAIGLGSITSSRISTQKKPQSVGGEFDPNSLVLTNAYGDRLLPVAMYRYQVVNTNYPTVSGDVVQVSPLMENIAYEQQTGPSATSTLHDPFITLTRLQISDLVSLAYLWLVDTQPIVSGASYRYVLVRFKPNREIDQVITSNEVYVP